MNHLLVCFSCFLAQSEVWRWSRWAKWEGTAPNSSKETGETQVHAWGKSPRTATPSAWSSASISSISPPPSFWTSFCVIFQHKSGSCFSRSPELTNSSFFFFFTSKNLFFSSFSFLEVISLYYPFVGEEDPSILTVRHFDVARYLILGCICIID